MILRVMPLEVSLYNVYIANQFQTTFIGGNSEDFCLNYVQEFGLWSG
jgi:hypothetical protein